MLDPRPATFGAAYTNPLANSPNGDAFFTPVNYSGAFDAAEENLWILGWTALDRNNHLGLITSTKETFDRTLANAYHVYPNPVASGASFELESALDEALSIAIYNQQGQLVAVRDAFNKGRNTIQVPALLPGLYYIKASTAAGHYYTTKLAVE